MVVHTIYDVELLIFFVYTTYAKGNLSMNDIVVPKKRNYLNNRDLLEQVKLSKSQKRMTNELAKMLKLLCQRYGSKGNYAGYTYNDDMQAYALMMLCKTWDSFDPEKSNNPFAFYTQCIKHSFSQYLNAEKKQRDVRDAILVENGLNPSFTYQMEHNSESSDTCVDSVYHGWGSDD